MEERQERRDGKIIERDIEKEMRTAYIDYAMSVIVSRALPDVRDGLKPVHRRILYSMHEDGITADKAYRKCANTVGSVLGRYHPHYPCRCGGIHPEAHDSLRRKSVL